MRNRNRARGALGLVMVLVLVSQAAVAAAPPPVTPPKLRGAIEALDDPSNEVAVRALEVLLTARLPSGERLEERELERIRAFVSGPRMGQLLRDPEPRTREAGAATLRTLSQGGEANQDRFVKRHAPALGELLKDPEARVRQAAAAALGSLGEGAKEQAPLLGKLLEDPEADVRTEAIFALGKLGQAAGPEYVSRLVHVVKADKDSMVRLSAAATLGKMGAAVQAQAPRLGELLKDPDPQVRQAAAAALGSLGPRAREQVPLLVNLLQDPNKDVREAATGVLERMGELARGQIPRLHQLLKAPRIEVRLAAVAVLVSMGEENRGPVPFLEQLLKDPDPRIRQAAVAARGWRGMPDEEQAPLLGRLLSDPNPGVRAKAAMVLGLMGEKARAQAPLLGKLLDDPDAEVRREVVRALEYMGEAAKSQVPLLVERLKDPDAEVRARAATALGDLKEVTKEQASRVGELLNDPDEEVQTAAVRALGEMGAAALEQAPLLINRLRKVNYEFDTTRALGAIGEEAKEKVLPLIAPLLEDPTPRMREYGAGVLGEMGEAAQEQAPLLGRLLNDADPMVRGAAAEALGKIGGAEREQAPLLGRLVSDPREHVADAATTALVNMAPVELSSLTPLMAQATISSASRPRWLLSTYQASGGDPRAVRLLRWVGRPPGEASSASLGIDEARETLQAFAEFWPLTEPYPELRRDLADQIAKVVRLGAGQWERADVELLRLHQQNLEQSGSTQVAAVQEVLGSLQRGNILTNIGWGWAAHAGFWLLLVFFYPRSSRVQALFFWNPWVRTFAGLGYVGLLLTWVPPLRRRLLAPFAPLLLAEADLEHFPARGYFPRSEVVTPSGQRVPLLTALPKLEGQVVLEGDSGLGKSMFLKYLLHGSKRLAVFLPAARCEGGVLEAIQAKLEGQAQDTAFLRSIIYSGALDIYIDGLNEVTASTRERIAQFTERNVHGNILLTTQRIEWTPPATARRYVLQPLTDAQVLEFLVSREPLLAQDAPLRGASFRSVCEDFVRRALTPDQPEPLRQAMREVLSNPLDLTVVAQMLAQGHAPDLFHLREQQYALMAREYRSKYLAPFPLEPFCEAAYGMRLEDQPVLPEERFSRELPLLEAFRIVLKRQWKGPDGKDHREWRFRHDKFHEYFIAQALKGSQREHLTEHVGDPRFQGVYLLLAQLLPPAEARRLRDLVVEHAVTTRDHSLSDRFVLLFKERREAEAAMGA